MVFNYVLCKYVAGLIQAGSFQPLGNCVISCVCTVLFSEGLVLGWAVPVSFLVRVFAGLPPCAGYFL